VLIPIKRVEQRAADKPPEITTEYVHPESIQRVREARASTQGPTVDILVRGEWIRVLGTVEEVGHTVNAFWSRELGVGSRE